MPRTLKPLNDIVILKKTEKTDMSPGGIALPGSAAEDQYIAEIVAVGPGTKDKPVPSNLQAGMVVVYDPSAVSTLKLDGQELSVIAAENLVGIVE